LKAKEKSPFKKDKPIWCHLRPVNKRNLKKPSGWHNLFEWILYFIPCLIKKLAEKITYLLKGDKKSIEYAKKWFIRSSFEFCYIFIAYYFTYCIFYNVHIEKLKGIEDFLYGNGDFSNKLDLGIVENIKSNLSKIGNSDPDFKGTSPFETSPVDTTFGNSDPILNSAQDFKQDTSLFNDPFETSSPVDTNKVLQSGGMGMESLMGAMGPGKNLMGSAKGATKSLGAISSAMQFGVSSLFTLICGYFTACMYVLPNIFSFSLSTALPKLFKALKIQDSYACTFFLIFVIMYIIVYFLLDKFGQMFLNVFYWKPDKSMIIFIIIGWVISFGDIMKVPTGEDPIEGMKNKLKRLQIFGPTLIAIGYLVHLALSIGLSGIATVLFLFFFFSTCLGIFLPSDFYSKVQEYVMKHSTDDFDQFGFLTNEQKNKIRPMLDNTIGTGTVIPSTEAFISGGNPEGKAEELVVSGVGTVLKNSALNHFLQKCVYPFFLVVILFLFFLYKFLESIIVIATPKRGSGRSGIVEFWAPITVINFILVVVCGYFYLKPPFQSSPPNDLDKDT